LVDTGQDEDKEDEAPVYDKFKKKDFSDFKIT
jgi:hypothetical protein